LKTFITFGVGMKKTAAILLLCIYSFATMGFSLKEFYCCGKLKSVSLTLAVNESNNFGKFNSKSDCCKNKFHFQKVKDGHLASVISINSFGDFSFLPHPYYTYDVRPYINFQSKNENIHGPPLYTGLAAYIANRVFRI